MTQNSKTLKPGKTYSKKEMLEMELAWAIEDSGEDSPSADHLRLQIESLETLRPSTLFETESWNGGIRKAGSQARDSVQADPMQPAVDRMEQRLKELFPLDQSKP